MERIPLRMGILNLLHEILHSFGASHDPAGWNNINSMSDLYQLNFIP